MREGEREEGREKKERERRMTSNCHTTTECGLGYERWAFEKLLCEFCVQPVFPTLALAGCG